MAALFKATLTYPDFSTTGLLLPLSADATQPPAILQVPADAPGFVEVFELVDDVDWNVHLLAGYLYKETQRG